MGRVHVTLLLVLLVNGCARQPAQCEVPRAQMPAAPQAEHTRRLVAALTADGSCHVKLQLPATPAARGSQAARDAILATAHDAALACCAHPQLREPSAWPVGATSVDVEFTCPPP